MNRRRLLIAGAIALVLSIATDVYLVMTDHHATELPGSGLVGYWPVFAVFWFLVFVFGSKWIGGLGIQQREDYYDESSDSDDDPRGLGRHDAG